MVELTVDDRLEKLRRLKQLKSEVSGGKGIHGQGQQPQDQPGALERLSTGLQGITEEVAAPFTFGLAGPVADIGAQAGRGLVNFIFEDVFGQEQKEQPELTTSRERRERFQETSPAAAATATAIGTLANPVTQRLAKPVVGGVEATGKAVSRVAEPVIKGTARLVEGAVKTAGEFVATPEEKRERARGKVLEALQRDGFTPEEAAARIERLGPNAAILDVGENTRALGFSVGNVPGKGKPTLKRFIEERQIGTRDPQLNIVGGQINRIRGIITDLVPQDAQSEALKLRSAKSAEGFYQQAYEKNQFVESSGLDRLLKRPSMQMALRQVAKLGREEGRNIARVDPELTALLAETGEPTTGAGVARGLKLQTYDQIKQILWDLEQQQKVRTGGRPNTSSRAITKTRRELIRELDLVDQQTTGGAYAAARLAAGDDLANVESLEFGAKFMSKSEFSTPEEMGEVISQMTPEGQHFFRIGAANAMKILAQNLNPRGDTTKKLFEQVGLEEKIKLAFGDRELFKKYIQRLTVEKELFKAVTDVLGNSKTAERQASMEDIGVDPGIVAQGARDLASGRLVQGTISIAKGLKDRATFPTTQAEEIAKILTGRDVPRLKK